jgi:hypothetical protein
MKKLLLPLLTLLFFNHSVGQQLFQLAPPVLQYQSAFFNDSEMASLKFAQPGTKIYYTLNGTEPTQNDAVYHKPVVVKKSLTTLKTKVFGSGFLPSETVSATFIKDGLKIKSVKQSPPNERYNGNGTTTLFDNEGGIADMHSKNFLGYQQDTVEVDITLDKKQTIHSALLNFLRDEGSWIFPPQKITIFYFDDAKNEFEVMNKKEIIADTIAKPNGCVFELVKARTRVTTDRLKIVIQPLQSIPGWHPGKGKKAWLFIDEIKIY